MVQSKIPAVVTKAAVDLLAHTPYVSPDTAGETAHGHSSQYCMTFQGCTDLKRVVPPRLLTSQATRDIAGRFLTAWQRSEGWALQAHCTR